MKVEQNPVLPLSYSGPSLQLCCDGHFDASRRSLSTEKSHCPYCWEYHGQIGYGHLQEMAQQQKAT